MCAGLLYRRRSVISEFDLVCDMDWAPQAVNSCYFIGFLIGAGLWGMASDRFGEQLCTVTAKLFPLQSLQYLYLATCTQTTIARCRYTAG